MCDKPVTSAAISLTDCLSCSGCVSITDDADTGYIEAIAKIKEGNVNIIITPQAKMALYTALKKESGMTFRKFECMLTKYLGVSGNAIIDSTVGSRILLAKEMQKITGTSTVISTICPGTVLYLCNSLDAVEPFLSNNLSPIELSAACIKHLTGAGPERLNISVVMCKDKRIEARNNSYIQYAITAKELNDHFLAQEWDMPEGHSVSYSGFEYTYSVSRIMPGSTSGGIFEGVLDRIISQAESHEDTYKIIKRSQKHNEILIRAHGKKVLQLFGSSRIILFITRIKKGLDTLSAYSYIEMNMCLGGCLFGPSQSAVVDAQLYTDIANDEISKESVSIDMEAITGTRAFAKYKKAKEKRNYLVEW